MNLNHRYLLTSAILIAFLAGAPHTKAESVAFTLDSTQSHLAISGSVIGNPLREQGPGSLTTTFSGQIKADLTDSSIQFDLASTLVAAVNGSWTPTAGGAAGTAPADYGAVANSIVGPVSAALRNIAFNLKSDPIPVNNGSFPATNLVFSFPTNSSAVFDYRSALQSGTQALGGNSTNQTASVATLTTSDTNQVLTIVLDGTFTFGVLNPDDSTARFTGQLIAQRALSGTSVKITSITLNSATVVMEATGGDTSYKLETSTDLANWSPTNVTPTSQGNKTIYSTTATGNLQFFRLKKP